MLTMKILNNHIFFMLILLLGCSRKDQEADVQSISITSENIDSTKTEFLNSIDNVDSLWNLITKINGCLGGGEFTRNGKFGHEECIMDNSTEWQLLFALPKDSLTSFLISKMDNLDTTYTHTCPFFLSLEGELAVYALQRIHHKHWFDFDDFSKYAHQVENAKPPVSNRESFQVKLQEDVLMNKKNREKLKVLWQAELESSKLN